MKQTEIAVMQEFAGEGVSKPRVRRHEQIRKSTLASGLAALALLIVASAALPADTVNRYDVTPLVDNPRASLLSNDPGSANPAMIETETAPALVLRHVEGIDPGPRAFDPGDIARELRDPFGQLLAAASDHLPSDVTELLALLDSLGTGSLSLADQTVYIVSEAGQIPVSAAPDLERRARAVIVRRDDDQARRVVFVAPSMRSSGTLEVMGWDDRKGRFNFYERRFSTSSGAPIWIWKGDSSHAWNVSTRDGGCFFCHRNGEPVMKELRQPWQNWHSQSAAIKPESIPDDSPLKADPLFSIDPPSPFLRKGEEFELIVRQWIANLNASRIAHYEAGKLSIRNLLEPLLRTTTNNLTASIDPSTGAAGPVRVPWTFFYNANGLADGAELICDEQAAFGQTVPFLDRSSYRDALIALSFEFGQGAFTRKPGDTHFGFHTPEPAQTDIDLIAGLVRAQIVSRRFAATLMLVDAPNAVYSPVREALFSVMPGWTIDDIGPDGVEAQLAELFVVLRDAGGQPPLVETALSEFLELWASPASEWEADACAKLEGYLGNVGERWRARDYTPYFGLLGARREAFLASDHGKLSESELLFPKSDADPGLVMHADGSVGPR